jgi:hypothetical protein
MCVAQVEYWNDGTVCGPRGGACNPIDLCPGDPEVSTKVMAVNLGGYCGGTGNINIDSVVFKA